MNWEKLRSPAGATCKNLNSRSLCERVCKNLELQPKTIPRFQSLNFESIDEWGRVMS